MAKPISMKNGQHDPRVELQARLENATAEHAEALLSGLEVLQCLHECGALELARGFLGSSDKVLEIAVDAAKSPTSIRGIRNLILLVNMFSELDPEVLRSLTRSLSQAIKSIGENSDPPSTWRFVMELLRNQDTRRGIGALNKVLTTFGRELATPKSSSANELDEKG